MKITRKHFLASLGCVTFGSVLSAAYMRFREPTWYEITEKDVSIGKFDEPVRVLHLSDFHASPEVSLGDIEKAIDLSLGLEADIAFLTGDFITWELSEKDEYIRILKKLSDRLPTFACIGNHEGGRWAGSSHGYSDFSEVSRLLGDSGITFLFNEGRYTTIRDQPVYVAGLGDLWSRDCLPETVLKKQRQSSEIIFLLSHNPDSKSLLKPYDWDVMFCGHTHGGQLVIPVLGSRPFLPVQDKSFPEGLLSWGNRHVHITRGIGNLHGLRFNCRPEISILNVV